MLRASPPLTAGQASHYYKAEFSRGDYYTAGEGDGIVHSRWHGQLAADLALKGGVKAEDFTRLLEGHDPRGRMLVAHREGKAERRAGWDVTISPHKSVSLAALVGGDGRLLEAHDRAVSKAVAELERHCQAWLHGGRELETTGRVIAASFRHETSRALDPQLHSHCVILNITKRADGEWRAVDARGIFKAQRLAREIYESELGRELKQLGYEVKNYRDGRHGRDRAVGIAGYRDEHLKHFSTRSRQIEKALKEQGLTSTLHGERVTLATRAVKSKGIDREALGWGWRTAAKEAGLTFPAMTKTRGVEAPRAAEAGRLMNAARDAVAGAVDHLGERRSVFRLADLEREALARGREHGVRIDDVRGAIDDRPDLVIAERGDALRAQVTTARAIEDERALVDAIERGRTSPSVITADVKPGHLADDQARVARHVLAHPDQLLAVEGKAGVGKSTTLAVVREHAEGAGWRVRGFAPTTTAAGVLREGGIDATTVAALLKEKPGAPCSRELWIVDEAGLLSTRQAREVIDRAAAEGAKVVLVGDRAQHRSIEAGSPFALLVDKGAATERLDTIRRQKDEQLRAAVSAASETGGVARAVKLLDDAGRVVEIEDPRKRHEQITRDFIEDGGRGVVIAPSNAERHDLNRRIREGLIARGQVEKQSVKAPVVVKVDMTADQKLRASSYSDGDVLRFVRKGDGIEAGQRGRVVGIDEKRNRLRVELDGGEVRELNPKERRGYEVERLEDRRFAKGDRVQFRERDRDLDVANGTIGTIRKVDHEKRVATIDVGGHAVRVDLTQPRALDHAYAVTSHRSQGLSRERVYLTVDTSHSEELVNRRQFYVSVSRAVEDAKVYTDDRSALTRAVSREQGHEGALEIAARSQQPSRSAPIARPLDVAERSPKDERAERAGAGRDAGRGAGTARRDEAPGRGAGNETRAAQGTARPERGRAKGTDRVPGPGAARATEGRREEAAGPRGAGEQRQRPVEPAAPGARRDDRAVRAAEAPADRNLGDRWGYRDDARRVRGGVDRGDELEARSGAGGERDGAGRGNAASGRGDEAGARTRDETRILTRAEVEASPELRKLYAAEYAATLRMVPDRELARDVARVNLTARQLGMEPVITRDTVARHGEGLRGVIEEARQSWSRLSEALKPVRTVARAIDRLRDRDPDIER